MPLRAAKFEDYWRAVYAKKYPIEISKIAYVDSPVFGGLTLDFSSGINCIAGKNGIGKSNFIRTLYNCLVSEDSNRKPFNTLIVESEVEISGQNDGQDFTKTFRTDEDADHEFTTYIFDACNTVPALQALLLSQENLEEYLEAFANVFFEDDEVAYINYLTNSSYSKIEIINIDEELGEFYRLPFFRVEKSGIKYDSRSMGLGELSAFYLYWLVRLIEKSPQASMLLVEESESFLPPLIQSRFANVLAMLSAKWNTFIILSTHSEHILQRVPRNRIQILQLINDSYSCDTAKNDFEALNILGLSSPKKGVILCEDDAAESFIKALIRRSSRFVSDSFYYFKCESAGDLLLLLTKINYDFDGFSLIGILDGDQRAEDLDLSRVIAKNLFFLPSSLPPEKCMSDFIKSKDTHSLAASLSVNTTDLQRGLDAAEGSNHHDYFREIARSIDEDVSTLFSKICNLWVSDERNSQHVSEFISHLEDR